MKKASFKALLFRELFLGRKQLQSGLIMFFACSTFGILMLLSFEKGNLALIPKDLRSDIKSVCFPIIQLMPVMAAGYGSSFVSESTSRDELGAWSKFRRTTPVTPWRFALARYTILLMLNLTSIALSIGYTAITCRLDNTKLTTQNVASVIAILLFTFIFGVLMQIFIMLFRSADIAGLTVTGLTMIPIFFIGFKLNTPKYANLSNEELFSMLGDFTNKLLPLAPFIFIIVMLCGYFATAMLYKRREK